MQSRNVLRTHVDPMWNNTEEEVVEDEPQYLYQPGESSATGAGYHETTTVNPSQLTMAPGYDSGVLYQDLYQVPPSEGPSHTHFDQTQEI